MPWGKVYVDGHDTLVHRKATIALKPASKAQRQRMLRLLEVSREVYYCGSCGHYEHADVNAARNVRDLGLAAEQGWRSSGSPLLERAKPRLRRGKKAPEAPPPAA